MSQLVRRWYGLLLRWFPADFRREFSREVLEVIGDDLEGTAGLRRIAKHLSATFDLVASLAHQRAEDCRRAAGWLLLGLAAANIGYDVLMPKLSMGFPAWAITLFAIASGAQLSRPSPSARRRT